MAPAPPGIARALASAARDPAQRIATLRPAPPPVPRVVATGGLLGAPAPGAAPADAAMEALRGVVLSQAGLAPKTLKLLPGALRAGTDDLALRRTLSAFEKGLEAELGATVWNSLTLVIGAPAAISTLRDGAAPRIDRVTAGAKLLNGIAKVAESQWPALAPYRQVLGLAVTGLEAGKVTLLFLAPPQPARRG